MSLPAHCPRCGDVIGVVNDEMMSLAAEGYIGRSIFKKPDVKGFFDAMDRATGTKDAQWDQDAPCRGTHGQSVRETLRRKFFNLIKIERTSYPDGSSSSWEEYDGPSSGMKFLLFLFYVKVLRNDVYTTNGKDWVWPFLKVSDIRTRV